MPAYSSNISWLALYVAAFLSIGHLQAQGFSVSCSAGDTVRQGEVLMLGYDFVDVSANSFRLPNLEGVQLLGGPSRRSQLSIVNLKRSSSETLIYQLVADRAGWVEIPAVTLDASAQGLTCESIKIFVTADPNYVSQKRELSPNAAYPAPPTSPKPPTPPARPRVKM